MSSLSLRARVHAGLRGALERLRPRRAGEPDSPRVHARESRLDFALQATGVAIWELDAASGAMWWSPAAGRMLGEDAGSGERSRVRLADVVERIHPDDRSAFQSAIADAVADPSEARGVQVRIVHPDGTPHWVELRGQPWRHPGGEGAGLRGTIVDVTPLKRVEAELRRDLDELRLVATVAECAACATDEEELLARVTGAIRDAFSPDRCGFLIFDGPGAFLRHAPSFHRRRPVEELRPVAVGTGIVGKVAASGESRHVDDSGSGPEDPPEPEMRSEICVPLKVGARVVGVLDVASIRPGAFGDRDEQLLHVVSSHVAGALDRLHSEAELHRSRELYRAYFTASPLAVFVADTNGRYLEVNGAATALTGYSSAELLRMSIGDLLVTEDSHELHERLVRLLALGSGRHEVRIRRKDDQVRQCLVHATAIGPNQLLGFFLDITDRRDAEERLRESEERFRGLSEASIEAILIHDQGRVVDVNQALCALGGYSWHELVGRDVFDLIAPEDRERVYRLLLAEYDQPYEITGLHRGGSPIPLEVRARSFPFRGQLLRVVALRDVSERRRAEEVRESLIRELEAKNTELERFTHTVSHDLKSPLITMRGFVGHMMADMQHGRSDRLVEDAGRVAEAAAKMQRLLDHLVELSQASCPVGPPSPVPLAGVVAEAARLAEERRGETGVRVEIGEGLPVVLGDGARLVRVFDNLIDNAIKFTRGVPGPRVAVEVAPSAEADAVVVVRDNGIGMDPAQRERVFGLFEKLDPAGEGMGMGLTLTRRVIETLGGSVRLQTRGMGEGVEAWVRLPAAPAAGGETSEVPATEAAGRPRG